MPGSLNPRNSEFSTHPPIPDGAMVRRRGTDRYGVRPVGVVVGQRKLDGDLDPRGRIWKLRVCWASQPEKCAHLPEDARHGVKASHTWLWARSLELVQPIDPPASVC